MEDEIKLYSNLNDEQRETTTINTSEFYDLLKSIKVSTLSNNKNNK